MSGISMVLNTAKLAISAQQIGMNVTGHNIANVNTPGYSRQSVLFENIDPVKLGNHLLGSGVSVEDVSRTSDAMLEGRLNEQKSGLAAFEQMDAYMNILEGLFNENSETSLSSQMSAFWNSWHALSNSPSGPSERIAVFDTADRLTEQFDWLDQNMMEMNINLTREIEAGVNRINTLAKQIAAINLDIAAAEVTANPNDQMDRRDQMVSELAQLVDISTFKQPSGTLTVVMSTGNMLVYGSDAYPMSMQQDRIVSEDASGSQVDLTNRIRGGKIGGWLEMRDEILPKFKGDLDSMAEEFIWVVNQVHSRGVGLDYFSDPLTGASRTDQSQLFDTLAFGDRIDYSGDFKVWVKDTGSSPVTYSDITVDMDISPVIVDNFTGAAPGSFQYRLTVTTAGTVGPAGTDPVISWERFNPDGTGTGVTGNVTVTDVNTLSATVDGLSFDIAAGELYAGNTFRINTDAAGAADNLVVTVPSGTANSANDRYVFNVKTQGEVGTDAIEIEWSNSNRAGTISLEPGALPLDIEVDGMTFSFASGTLFGGDEFTVTTDSSGNATTHLVSDWHWNLSSFAGAFNNAADTAAGGGPGSGYVQASVSSDNRIVMTPRTGYQFAFSDDQVQDSGVAAALGLNTFFTGWDASSMGINSVLSQKDYIAAARIDGGAGGNPGQFGVGDNSNAIAIADLQYASRPMVQWTYVRGYENTSRVVTASMEGYYQGMIGSLGIKAESIARNTEFAKVMVDKISEQRDSLSGVNLDEEMINLMKYQHAFVAASKLLTAADEMLQTLLASK